MQRSMLTRLVLAVLIVAAMVSATYFVAVPVYASGEYNCCGDSQCDVVKRSAACPDGTSCSSPAFHNCCDNACYMEL